MRRTAREAGLLAALAGLGAVVAGTLAAAPASACDRSRAPSFYQQARQSGVALAVAVAKSPQLVLIREGIGGIAAGVQLDVPPAKTDCDVVLTTGAQLIVALKRAASGQGWQPVYGADSVWALARDRDPAALKRAAQAIRDLRDAQTSSEQARAILALMPLERRLARDARADLEKLAQEGSLPTLLVNEVGRRAIREKLPDEELAAYLSVGRILKPLWYEKLVLSRLATAKGNALYLFGLHSPACPDDRGYQILAKRLRDRDRLTRDAAMRALTERTQKTLPTVEAWEAWVKDHPHEKAAP